MLTLICVAVLLAALGVANGSNDVSKGIATLAGSGVTRYQTAIVWGTVTTLAGSLLSLAFADRMLKLFTAGIVSAKPTGEFTLAVLCGAAGWVLIATVMRLPVSTTHAIIGSMLGAGVTFAPASVAWSGLLPRLAAPLLVSIAVSYLLSALLNRVFALRGSTPDCICVGIRSLDAGVIQLQQPSLLVGHTQECARQQRYLMMNLGKLHWLSSGAVGFARGLNDTPKLVAIGAVVLGAKMPMGLLLLIVAISMAAGSLYAGRRVARVLAERIVMMDHREGLLANLATATLAGFGANFGLPMSTTHLSAGAIAGIAGACPRRLDWKTLRDLILAWTVTPMVAGVIATLIYRLVVR